MEQQKKTIPKNPAANESLLSRLSGPLIVLLLICLISGTVFFFIKHGPIAVTTYDTAAVESTEDTAYGGPLVNIGDFIVNIISEDGNHYLRASITIEATDSKRAEEVNRRMPMVRDAVLMLISNKTFEELYDMHGKKQLKAELLLEINSILSNEGAAAIYFTDFVVQ